MSQPKLKIEKENIDWIIEAIALLGLIFLIGYPILNFDILPDKIPSHFNALGDPDSYTGKGVIWALPAIGVFMYFLLTIISRNPHSFNYSVKITEENAPKQYKIAVRMMGFLKAIIVVSFAYITYTSIQVVLENKSGLGNWFLPVLLVVVFGSIFYSFKQSKQNK